MDKKAFVIAIDGPVASGKGTIAISLAGALDGSYLSTGAMYRAVALYCHNKGIDVGSEEKVLNALVDIEIGLDKNLVFLNGEDITQKLKEQNISNAASIVGIFPKIRQQLVLRMQQIANTRLAAGKIVVSEGRDTGTVVFPHSPMKIFLTAEKNVRAQRRLEQYNTQGQRISLDEVVDEINERDKRDTERVADPLPKEPQKFGYFILDSSNLTEEQTVQVIIEELRRRGLV